MGRGVACVVGQKDTTTVGRAAAGAAPGNEQGARPLACCCFSPTYIVGRGVACVVGQKDTTTVQGEGDGKSQIFGVRGVS